MIINQRNQFVRWENDFYPIGGKIKVQESVPYAGLYGTITEIKTGKDRVNGSQTVNIICLLMPPVLPGEITAFEQQYSKFSGNDTALADVPLADIILEPHQIQVLFQDTDTIEIPVYVLREDWAIEGDYGSTMSLTANYDEAKWEMAEMIQIEMKEGILLRLLDRSDLDTDHGENHYECWLNGRYSSNHYLLEIVQESIKFPRSIAEKMKGALK